MMIQNFTLHTHTIGFDGRDTPAEIPVLLSDDAHCVEHIGRHFVRGFDCAMKNGVHTFLTLREVLHTC